MPISSGPIGLTRAYGEAAVTWNQPGLSTHSEISSVHVLSRPSGAACSRDVNVLFGHAQLIPTFTLRPEEEYKEPASAYLDASQAPAPRPRPASATGRPRADSFAIPEGDTTATLGLEQKETRWANGVIKPTESSRPLGGDRPALTLTRGPRSTARSRSRSPTGRNKPSSRAPQFLASSLNAAAASPVSSRVLRARAAGIEPDSRAEQDVARGSFTSPHSKDLARARQYVSALDAELQENALAALAAEKRAVAAAEDAAIERSRRKKEEEWNRDLMLGVHVRAVGMERKWHQRPGMERISGLYDPTRDVNATSTSILQESIRPSEEPNIREAGLLDRTVALHSPRSSRGLDNVTYARERETTSESMPDKSVDLGFAGSGKRRHEEALGGKTLLKTRAWPRDPVPAPVGRPVYTAQSTRDVEYAHGVNTSTTSARVRAQAASAAAVDGEMRQDLLASFTHTLAPASSTTSLAASIAPSTKSDDMSAHTPSSSVSSSRRRSTSASGGRVHATDVSTALTSTPTSISRGASTKTSRAASTKSSRAGSKKSSRNSAATTPKSNKKKLRPSSAAAARSPLPYSTSYPRGPAAEDDHEDANDITSGAALHNLSLSQVQAPPSFHTNPLNTSEAALLNNSVTAASVTAQRAHAATYTQDGALRAHPRGVTDALLREHGINVASGFGGLGEDETLSHATSVTSAGRSTRASSQAPVSLRSEHGVEGNGAILDLAPALAARAKSPWKYGGAKDTRRHDRKHKTTEDLALAEARKKRLPSGSRGARPSSAPSHRSGHTVGGGGGGGSGFVIGRTTLKPSLHLRESGRHILGRTRVTSRVDLDQGDWAHLKRKEKELRQRAYSASRRGPSDPRPHNTSVIEEAMAMERAARREREIVAREREWRAQQAWLHEKKRGLDRLAAKKRSEVRKMPPRPPRNANDGSDKSKKKSPRGGDEDAGDDDVSVAGGGAAKPWGGNLLVPEYMEGMGRVAHDIDVDAEVRGATTLAQRQARVVRQARADATASTSVDWASRHHLSDDELPSRDPLTDTYDDDEEEGDLDDEGLDDDDEDYDRRPVPPSNRALDRGAEARLEVSEFDRVRETTAQVASSQESRERAAERAQTVAASLAEAEAARQRARDLDEATRAERRQSQIEAARRTQEAQAKERARLRIGAQAPHLSFTASPRRSSEEDDEADGTTASNGSTPGVGASSLLIAQSYDRRLRDLTAFLRARHPFMPAAERDARAHTKARELVQQELARMGPSGGQSAPSSSSLSQSTADWFTDYQQTSARREAEAAHAREQEEKYVDDANAAAAAPRTSSVFRERYERMQRQATERHAHQYT